MNAGPDPGAVRVLAPGTLAGQTALVTGAGSGIGRAIALRLCQLGADVVGLGRHADRLAATGAQARGAAGRWRQVTCDVRDPDAVAAAVAEAAAPAGLTALVNNAGGQFFAPAAGISHRGWRSVVELNLNAVFDLCREARAHLAEGGGAIVNISISGVNRGGRGMAHSMAARAGVLAMTRTLALEWANQGIRLNCIGPGTVLTEAVVEETDPATLERLVTEGTPLRRATSPEEVAELTAYLCSPAGALMTGQLIQVDGGSHIGPGLHMVEADPR